MTRKRLLIVGGAILAVVLIGLMGGFGMMEQLFESDEGTAEQASDGQTLYSDIMGRHPLLLDRSSFERSAEDAGSDVNKMRLPHAEWTEIDQQQKNSLAQFLDSMGSPWRIEVGQLSKDGQRLRSLRAVMSSIEWHDVVK